MFDEPGTGRDGPSVACARGKSGEESSAPRRIAADHAAGLQTSEQRRGTFHAAARRRGSHQARPADTGPEPLDIGSRERDPSPRVLAADALGNPSGTINEPSRMALVRPSGVVGLPWRYRSRRGQRLPQAIVRGAVELRATASSRPVSRKPRNVRLGVSPARESCRTPR